MTAHTTPVAVSFDFGQTLVDIDFEMLSRRLAERGAAVQALRLSAGAAVAWQAYNNAVKRGVTGHPWKVFMRRMLEAAEAPERELDALTEWLWSEQPHKNLWRSPIPEMIDVVASLRRAGVPVAIVSNSEGRLAELVEEIGWSHFFGAIADSGKLGVEKPSRAIFDWAADRLGVRPDQIVHIGDSLAADVEGALGAGLYAIWFGGDRGADLGERARVCHGPGEVRAALAAWGLPLSGRD